MRYQFVIRLKDGSHNNAGSKAVLDCCKILECVGYQSIILTFKKSKLLFFLNLFKLIGNLLKYIFTVRAGSVITVQYPVLGINAFMRYFIVFLKLKRCQFICLIHDLDKLRYYSDNSKEIGKEINNLKYYDCIISHNAKMTQWLICNGIKRNKIIHLDVFDYLIDIKNGKPDPNSKGKRSMLNYSVAFAGNLSKSGFIYKLDNICDIEFGIYGSGFERNRFDDSQCNNVKWRGAYSAEEVPFILSEHFGLVWDGDTLDACNGVFGEYMRYNSPHKASLYIAAGLPLIVPRRSAIADLVLNKKIGIVVDSLNELPGIFDGLILDQYAAFVSNLNALRSMVIQGGYLVEAVREAEFSIGAEKNS